MLIEQHLENSNGEIQAAAAVCLR